MKDAAPVRVSGSVRDIFAHRFVLRTEDGPVLADLGPKGGEKVTLRIGDEVQIEGERRPSEIKVSRLLRGSEVVDLSDDEDHRYDKKHKDPGEDEHDSADPQVATRAARAAGLLPIAPPRRKHRHFEVLARDPDGHLLEFHVELDGAERKRKLIDDDDDKWSEDIKDEP